MNRLKTTLLLSLLTLLMVYIIPDESPNAFTTGRNPEHAAVAATLGILPALSSYTTITHKEFSTWNG